MNTAILGKESLVLENGEAFMLSSQKDPLSQPHPHEDPRQPLNGASIQTNPPVFVGAYQGKGKEYRLQISTERAFSSIQMDVKVGTDPMYLPEKALAPGNFFWKWLWENGESEIFSFTVPAEAVVLEIPSVDIWLSKFAQKRPRVYFLEHELEELRASRFDSRKTFWHELKKDADAYLGERHHLPEPDFLPDQKLDSQAYMNAQHKGIRDSRLFTIGANVMALAYLACGEQKYARAACERIASICQWDPDGSTHLAHQDETHMAVIMHGPPTCDWIWEHFTTEEKKTVIGQYRRRGQITFAHMHDAGCYGIDRFDNHSVREVIFLAQLAIVFHEHIPEAREWLVWLRPILCGVWPTWGRDDGSWAEGFMYGCTYITHMTMFITTLHRGVGVNLFERPFWKNNIRWRMQTAPVYSKKFLSFGDGSSPMRGLWRMTADLVRLVAHSTKTSEFDTYLAELEGEIPRTQSGVEDLWYFRKVSPLQYLCGAGSETKKIADVNRRPAKMLSLFPEGGWAAIRSAPHDPENDVAFIFRSSPYGNDSHSHANQNDFILHAGGEALLHPSGYYDGWGTHHQTSWVWHSRSHNCLTLSGASQLLRSREARGAVVGAFEDERLVYFLGNADRAYANQVRKCRRHVLFFKNENVFLLLDEVSAKPGQSFQIQWNAHSFEKFKVDPVNKKFSIKKNKVLLEGRFLYSESSFFTQSEGFEPDYHHVLEENLKFWGNQHHLQFVASTYAAERRIGILLAPRFGSRRPPEIETNLDGHVECARFGDIEIRIRQGERLAPKNSAPNTAPFLEVRIGESYLKIGSDGICEGLS